MAVEQLKATSFPKSRRYRIEIEGRNRHFHMKHGFLMHLNYHWAVRYPGFGAPFAVDVTIPEENEIIEDGCFLFCESVRSLRIASSIGSTSQVSSIGSWTFWYGPHRERITIRSSVPFLGDGCFNDGSRLHAVSFASGSPLNGIPDQAFAESLASIIRPECIETVAFRCVGLCHTLQNSPLSLGSEVVRLGEQALADSSFVG